jgi:hypothetical protein
LTVVASTLSDAVSFAASVVGAVLGIVSIIVTVSLYLKSKRDSRRAAETLETVRGDVDLSSKQLREVIEVQASLLGNATIGGFLVTFVERAERGGRQVRVGDLRIAARTGGIAQTDFENALRRLRGRLAFEGDLDRADTLVVSLHSKAIGGAGTPADGSAQGLDAVDAPR